MSRPSFENKLTLGTIITILTLIVGGIAAVAKRETDLTFLNSQDSKQEAALERHAAQLAAVDKHLAVEDETLRHIAKTLERIETSVEEIRRRREP